MNLRNLMIWGLFVAVLLTLFYSVMNPAGGRGGQSAGELTYSQLQQKTDANQVAKAVVRGEQVTVEDKDSRRFNVVLPLGGSADILKRFEAHGVNVQAQSTQPSPWMQLLGALLPFVLLGALWFFFMRPGHERRRPRRHGLRQVQGQAADREQDPRHLRGRGGRGRGQGRAGRDRRVPEGARQVPAPGRQDPQGRAAGRPPRHRQDAAGPRGRRRGGRALLLHLRLRLRGDVRGRGRQPRARHVRAGQEERPLHHLHRRDRRGGPPPRRRPGRRQRRARADAEPAPRGDGRLRGQRGHHPDRGHQPAGRAGPRAAAPGPLRPPGGGAQPRRDRPRADHPRAHAQRAPGRRRGREDHRPRHPRLLRRGPDEPRQRGRPVRRAPQQEDGQPARLRAGQGQGDDGRRAQVHGHDRGGEEAHRVPRGRPRHPGALRPLHRPRAQGDHHPARPRAGHGDAAAGGATATR